jgi:hypothetical protein
MRGFITFNIAALAVVMALPSVAFAGDPAPSGAEREFAGLLNQERARQGLPALATSPALTDVADDYVAENVARGGITHDRDAPFTARAEQAGCTGWSGPVLGEGYANPAQALQGWLDSPGHRAILLDPSNTHVGAGFKGGQALAFVLHCASGENAGAVLWNSVPGGLGAFRMSSRRPSVRGRTISTRVRIRAGKGKVGLVARSGKRAMRGRRVSVVKRVRPYRLAVKVSRPGRWKVSLRVNGRITRRFTVRVRSRR